MKEAKFTKELRQSIALKWPGSATLKIPGTAMNAGLPDLIAIISGSPLLRNDPDPPGATMFIEAKCYQTPPVKPFRLMAKVSERQKATLSQIARAGGKAFVIIRFSALHAAIFNWAELVDSGNPEGIKLDPDPHNLEGGWTVACPVFGLYAISQRRSGGVWDNLEFLTW